MKIRLKIETPSAAPWTWDSAATSFVVGRHPDCDLALNPSSAEGVSANHARFDVTHNGLIVTDLESTNGTFVNGKRINSPTRLNISDAVELGPGGHKLTLIALDLSLGGRPVEQPRQDRHVAVGADVARGEHRKTSVTQTMLKQFRREQKNLWIFASLGVVGVVGVALVLMCVMGWGLGIVALDTANLERHDEEVDRRVADVRQQTQDLEDEASRTGQQVYQGVLRSAVWVVVSDGSGSGSLIDYDARLIITNYHVVEEDEYVKVYFPRYQNGQLVKDRSSYRSPIRGKVVHRSQRADLALVQLESLPRNVRALTLADESPATGEDIYLVGNTPYAGDALWVFTSGQVRTVIRDSFSYGTGQHVDAMCVISNCGSNSGDSGGPVVNRLGEMVAVHAASSTDVRLMSTHIDISEVKQHLQIARDQIR